MADPLVLPNAAPPQQLQTPTSAVYPPVSYILPAIAPTHGWYAYSSLTAHPAYSGTAGHLPVTAPLPALVTPSFSMPTSLAPALQDQVHDMTTMFAVHDNDASLASYSTNTSSASLPLSTVQLPMMTVANAPSITFLSPHGLLSPHSFPGTIELNQTGWIPETLQYS